MSILDYKKIGRDILTRWESVQMRFEGLLEAELFGDNSEIFSLGGIVLNCDRLRPCFRFAKWGGIRLNKRSGWTLAFKGGDRCVISRTGEKLVASVYYMGHDWSRVCMCMGCPLFARA